MLSSFLSEFLTLSMVAPPTIFVDLKKVNEEWGGAERNKIF